MKRARLRQLRQLLWLYFWLLIFEGALRKWVLPGLSNPLLLVREPVALLALWWGWPLLRQRRWQIWLLPLLLIGLLALLLAVSVGHGDLFTALYGSRILLIQLPLIFVFAAAFNRDDVIRFAWVLAWLSIPMTLLIVAQSNLPSGHILNVAPGGEGTAVFSGALGRFRPPGLFSFISGVSSFYTLAASSLFILFYGVALKQPGRLFGVAVGIALLVALPVSISRTLLAGYLQVVAALIAALVMSRARLMPVVSGLLALLLAGTIAINVPAFQNTSGAFLQRWENASRSENQGDDSLDGVVGVVNTRFIPEIMRPFVNLGKVPLLGYGVGMGSQVGATRLTGSSGWQLGEGAWESSMGEMGIILGPVFLAWRVLLSFWIMRIGFLNALKGDVLPLILAGSSFLPMLFGQIGQPTGLGFLVFSAGLTLAASNHSTPTSRLHYRVVTKLNHAVGLKAIVLA